MPTLLIKLILAHLIGDFVLQSDRMVADIERKKWRSVQLYGHILIHFALIIILTGFELQYLVPAILLSLAHLAIDLLTKIILQHKVKNIYNLIIDQSLHLCTILLFVRYFHEFKLKIAQLAGDKQLLLLTALIMVTYVTSVVIKKILDRVNFRINKKGIKDAGKLIGMLERLFVFGFVVMSFWEGIGFLLAAKSIFRFGDLKENKEIQLTEYILVGTLLSFGFAILIGMAYLKLKAMLVL